MTQTKIAPAPSSYGSGTVVRVKDRLVRTQARIPLVQVVLLVVAVVVGITTLPGFASPTSLTSMLVLAALVGLAAIGQTFVVLVGGFDLSVSGFMVAGAVVVTQITVIYKIPFALALLYLVVGAAILGVITGWICHRYQVQPLIITFAMGSIVLGVTQLQTAGSFSGGAPQWLSELTSPASSTFGIPVPPIVAIWVVVTVLIALFLSKTSAGRRVFATGANIRAAENSLIRTRLVWMLVFGFSAVAGAVAGVFLAGFAGTVDATLGGPYLFQSLAAVIVGGTVFGGPGGYVRTAIGALLLTVLTTLLIGNGFSGADQQMLYGAIILVFVALYGRERRLQDSV